MQGNADPAALPFVLLEELGPLLVLGLVGAGLALRAPAARRLALAGAVLAAAAMLGALGAGLDPVQPRHPRLPGAWRWPPLAAFGAAALAPLLGVRAPAAAGGGGRRRLLLVTHRPSPCGGCRRCP